MNELEKMKELWNEVQGNNKYEQLNKTQIMENLSLKSNNVFVKLSKSVKIEYVILSLTLPIVLFTTIVKSSKPESFNVLLLFAAVIIFYGVFFWKDFKKIEQYAVSSQNLSQRLAESITHLEKFAKLYFRTNMFLWPLVGVFYYYMFHVIQLKATSLQINWLWLAVSAFIATGVGYFIQKWYTQKMYGKYIYELKKLQEELIAEN